VSHHSLVDLQALLAPRSVAVLGASNRPGRPGYQVMETLRLFDSELSIRPITPRYEEILGMQCYGDIASAPASDLVVVAGASERILSDVEAAIAAGSHGILVFGAPDAHDNRGEWVSRLGALAKEAGIPLLGPDTLGYVNYAQRIGATWAIPEQTAPGGIAIVSQSGTVYWEAITNDPRLRFSFSGHSGLEVSVTIADLITFAADLPSTRVIGLYVETIRDPDGFVAALEAAEKADVPIVAMYAGRTKKAQAQLMTHAGRMAGDHATFEGLFRKYGVARVRSSEEWWTTLALFGGEHRLGEGGVAAVMDSGGGLAMFHDYADELNVPLAEFSETTIDQIHDLLGPDIDTDGAIDFWVGDSNRHARTEAILTALAADQNTAAVLAFTTYAESPTAGFAVPIADACASVSAQFTKPVIAVTYTSRALYPDLMLRLVEQGVTVLDGMSSTMSALRHAFDFRDHTAARSRPVETAKPWDDDFLQRWTRRLAQVDQLAEADALELLTDAGIPCVRTIRAASEDQAAVAAATVGYPLVLKTDEGIAHKAAMGGVRLSLSDETSVRDAYREMSSRLGPRVILAPMASGLEAAIGVVRTDVGPLIMFGVGGTAIEHSADRCYLLGEVSAEDVNRAASGLQLTRNLRAHFGQASAAELQLHQIVSAVSRLAAQLGEMVAELDINPILVSERGCLVVDALVGVSAAESVIGP